MVENMFMLLNVVEVCCVSPTVGSLTGFASKDLLKKIVFLS